MGSFVGRPIRDRVLDDGFLGLDVFQGKTREPETD